jgi:hypothetical protein
VEAWASLDALPTVSFVSLFSSFRTSCDFSTCGITSSDNCCERMTMYLSRYLLSALLLVGLVLRFGFVCRITSAHMNCNLAPGKWAANMCTSHPCDFAIIAGARNNWFNLREVTRLLLAKQSPSCCVQPHFLLRCAHGC